MLSRPRATASISKTLVNWSVALRQFSFMQGDGGNNEGFSFERSNPRDFRVKSQNRDNRRSYQRDGDEYYQKNNNFNQYSGNKRFGGQKKHYNNDNYRGGYKQNALEGQSRSSDNYRDSKRDYRDSEEEEEELFKQYNVEEITKMATDYHGKLDELVDEDAVDKENITVFEDLPEHIRKNLAAEGVNELFQVQQKVFQPFGEGHPLIVRSFTGSGKTLAFLLPIWKQLQEDLESNSADFRRPKAIIMQPTRELARQVKDEINKFMYNFNCTLLMGGERMGPQIQALNRGCQIIVATPGRLNDFISKGLIDLTSIRHIVMDEGDEMLKIGFQKEIDFIFSSVMNASNGKAISMIFSATIPPWILEIAKQYLGNYKVIDISGELLKHTPEKLDHIAIRTMGDPSSKATMVRKILRAEGKYSKGLIFTETRREADQLKQELNIRTCEAIHGNRDQKQRANIMNKFRRGYINLLIATDVAARGLDIPDIDYVINYSANSDNMYVHRAGRAGRAGKEGLSYILYDDTEDRIINDIEDIVDKKVKRVSEQYLEQVYEETNGNSNTKSRITKAKFNLGRMQQLVSDVDPESVDRFRPLADDILHAENAHDLVASLISKVVGDDGNAEASLLSGMADFITIQIKPDERALRNGRPDTVVSQLFSTVKSVIESKLKETINRIERCADPKDGLVIEVRKVKLGLIKSNLTDSVPELVVPDELPRIDTSKRPTQLNKFMVRNLTRVKGRKPWKR